MLGVKKCFEPSIWDWNSTPPVVIEDNVFIGSRSIVVEGFKIEQEASYCESCGKNLHL